MIFKYLLSMATRQITRRRKSRAGLLLAVGAGAAVAGAAAGALLWPRHGAELGKKIKNRAEQSADRLKQAVSDGAQRFNCATERAAEETSEHECGCGGGMRHAKPDEETVS